MTKCHLVIRGYSANRCAELQRKMGKEKNKVKDFSSDNKYF